MKDVASQTLVCSDVVMSDPVFYLISITSFQLLIGKDVTLSKLIANHLEKYVLRIVSFARFFNR